MESLEGTVVKYEMKQIWAALDLPEDYEDEVRLIAEERRIFKRMIDQTEDLTTEETAKWLFRKAVSLYAFGWTLSQVYNELFHINFTILLNKLPEDQIAEIASAASSVPITETPKGRWFGFVDVSQTAGMFAWLDEDEIILKRHGDPIRNKCGKLTYFQIAYVGVAIKKAVLENSGIASAKYLRHFTEINDGKLISAATAALYDLRYARVIEPGSYEEGTADVYELGAIAQEEPYVYHLKQWRQMGVTFGTLQFPPTTIPNTTNSINK